MRRVVDMRTEALSPHLAAEIRDCDLRRLGAAEVDAIREAFLRHLVLVFRGQQLTDEELLAFGADMGEVDLVPFYDAKPFYPEVPDGLQVMANVGPNGEAIGGLANNEAHWHSDMSYAPAPPAMSLLYALEVPPAGGDTAFLSMYEALRRLPDELRAAAESAVVEHDGAQNSAGKARARDAGAAMSARHPAVHVHPETRQAALFLGRRQGTRVVSAGTDPGLLDALWDKATDQAAYGWQHSWRSGDVVMWDNRCTLHRRDGFDAAQRRVLRRLQTRGTAPVAIAISTTGS